MTLEIEEIEEPKRLCPTCNCELLASALDGHLFCADCGYRPEATPEVTDDNS